MNEEDLSKTLKESVDPKGIIFPPPPIIYWSKDWLGQKKLKPSSLEHLEFFE